MSMILNINHSKRLVALVTCEVSLVIAAFLVAALYVLRRDAYIGLVYESGLMKIGAVAVFTILLSYYFDLYQPQRISGAWEMYFRLFLVLSVLSFFLAALVLVFPNVDIGRHVLALGVALLTVLMLLWKRVYEWLLDAPLFRERVFVIGDGKRARTLVDLLRTRRDACMDVVGWTDDELSAGGITPAPAEQLTLCAGRSRLDRVIVAMEDRRNRLPVRELLRLRLQGVVVEDSATLLERITGIVPIDGTTPSSLIFSHGFSVSGMRQFWRRLLSMAAASLGLLVCLPFLPFIALAVRLSSKGPVLFSQMRVGRHGRLFRLYKFRTMRQDAECNGAVWAVKHDPRVTRVGRVLRKTRLDEIPQLWNVLRGDMGFVGPRPERPEFVQWLNAEIPYYDLRHMVRPGLTGWAQVRYQYGASLEETRRKLEYDLYYLKHLSVGLDLLIIFETLKTVILGRGAQ